jgi:hypothetical protein
LPLPSLAGIPGFVSIALIAALVAAGGVALLVGLVFFAV